jgi:hypothetical protein
LVAQSPPALMAAPFIIGLGARPRVHEQARPVAGADPPWTADRCSSSGELAVLDDLVPPSGTEAAGVVPDEHAVVAQSARPEPTATTERRPAVSFILEVECRM